MLRVLSLFSGIGAFEVALDEENIDWELDHYCEIDKYACRSYNCIHGTTDENNLKDVTNIDYSKIGRVDLVTYGFPCQDISLAGNQKGFVDEDGNITRSGLFFNAADIIRHTKPKFAIFENVKNLTSKKFKNEFETVLNTLDGIGYKTYWKVLNAKDYGIPQNRERVFGISIRKDIDHGYEFPRSIHLHLRLKDVLEKEVDEKYYLSGEQIKRFTTTTFNSNKFESRVTNENGIVNTLLARDHKGLKCVQVAQMYPASGNPQAGRIYSKEGVSPSLDTCGGGNRMPKIIVKENTKKGYTEAEAGDSINLEQPNSKTRRGRVGKGVAQTLTTSCNQAIVEPVTTRGSDIVGCIRSSIYKQGSRNLIENVINGLGHEGVIEPVICASRGRNPENPSSRVVGEPTEQRLEVNKKGLCNTLTTVQKDNYVLEPIYKDLCIRKLTPRECWRLMGFKDKYFDRVQGVSNSQLYKQAGNSIVVDVLRAIFRELKNQYPDDFEDVWEDDL